jgi:heterodisulfide reductase subunit B
MTMWRALSKRLKNIAVCLGRKRNDSFLSSIPRNERTLTLTKRKTFEVSTFVEMCNGVLANEEFLQRDKEVVSAILESILEKTGNKFSYEGEGYSRRYVLK